MVSILLLGWNHEKYIEQCIKSIIAQTYENIEVLFLDNNSSDETYNIGLYFLKDFSNFRAFRNQENKSIAKNFNFLLKASQGKYIIPLSTDDWLEHNFIEEKVTYYEAHPSIGMLYNGGYIYYDDQKKLVEAKSTNFKRGKIFKDLFHQENILFFIGIFYKRTVLEELGGWDENLLIEDLDLFIRISMKYEIDYIPKPLATYRKINTSASQLSMKYEVDYIPKPLATYRKINTSASQNIQFMVKGWEQYFEKYAHLPDINMKKWLAEKYRAYAALAIDNSNFNLARQLLLKSLRLDILNFKSYRTLFFFNRKWFISKFQK